MDILCKELGEEGRVLLWSRKGSGRERRSKGLWIKRLSEGGSSKGQYSG